MRCVVVDGNNRPVNNSINEPSRLILTDSLPSSPNGQSSPQTLSPNEDVTSHKTLSVNTAANSNRTASASAAAAITASNDLNAGRTSNSNSIVGVGVGVATCIGRSSQMVNSKALKKLIDPNANEVFTFEGLVGNAAASATTVNSKLPNGGLSDSILISRLSRLETNVSAVRCFFSNLISTYYFIMFLQ